MVTPKVKRQRKKEPEKCASTFHTKRRHAVVLKDERRLHIHTLRQSEWYNNCGDQRLTAGRMAQSVEKRIKLIKFIWKRFRECFMLMLMRMVFLLAFYDRWRGAAGSGYEVGNRKVLLEMTDKSGNRTWEVNHARG